MAARKAATKRQSAGAPPLEVEQGPGEHGITEGTTVTNIFAGPTL